MKKMIRMAAIGSVVGGLTTSWVAPKAISWYFTPPIQQAINCQAPIDWALRKLQLAQLFGTLAGAVIFLVLALTIFKGKEENSGETI